MNDTLQQQKQRHPGGRPKREDAEERDRRLLRIAAAMFESRGFEGTTIEALAEAAGVGKPTVYARFRNKTELFAAVFRKRVDVVLGMLAPEAEHIARRETDADLETALQAFGLALLRHVLSEEAIRMHRVIVSTAIRFPELAQLVHHEGWERIVTVLAGLLHEFVERGDLEITDEVETADMFLSLVLGRYQRVRILGLPGPDQVALQRQTHNAVTLFLNGIRRHPAG
ncbi:MAG: TetR/AcrR family transcriptional regulator [Janthinobacterium lividum]